jgi:group I intron endonuclease
MAKVILARQGIYCIRCMANGRVYVGSALRIDLRWNLHRSDLRRGQHRSIRFQRAWNKYGADAFEWSTLELVADRKGKPKSAAHRAAIGAAHKGRTLSAEQKAKIAAGVRRHMTDHPESHLGRPPVAPPPSLAQATVSAEGRD